VLAVADEMLVDLVADANEVVLDTHPGDRLELAAAEHASGRIVGRVQKQHLRAGAGRGLQRVDVERELRRAQRDRPPARARECDARRVGVVVGLEHDHLVTRVQRPQQRRRDRLGRAERSEHVFGARP
jgi:hypothetical protein